jgi:hypothetical protein
MFVVVLLLLTLGVASVALGTSRSQTHGSSPPVRAKTSKELGMRPFRFTERRLSLSTLPVGADPKQLLADLVARLPATTPVTSIEISAPPADIVTDGTWLTAHIPSASGSDATYALWQVSLVAGALREALKANQLPDVTNVSIIDGAGNYVGDTGIGNVVQGQSFSGSTATDQITEAAARAGLKVQSITFFNVLQPAPAVVLVTTDPKSAVENSHDLLNDITGATSTYEGSFVEILDGNGKPVLMSGRSQRTGNTVRWVRPDLDPFPGSMYGSAQSSSGG